MGGYLTIMILRDNRPNVAVSGSEREVCIEVEVMIRDAVAAGLPLKLVLSGGGAVQRERAADYLNGITEEIRSTKTPTGAWR